MEEPIVEKKKFSLKDFWIDAKKFLWYLVTEPFRIIKNGFMTLKTKVEVVHKIKAWMFVFGIITLLSVLTKNLLAAKVFAALFLLSVIHHEWQRGYFRKRWKDREKIRAYKLMKRTEVEKDGIRSNNSLAMDSGKRSDTDSGSATIMGGLPPSKKG